MAKVKEGAKTEGVSSTDDALDQLVAIGKELSPEHERFCREFIIDDNQTRAYMRVYPDTKYFSAAASATRLLKDDKITDRILTLRDERNKRLEVSADRVLSELAKVAFSDPRKMFDDKGGLIPIHEMDADQAAIISSIEHESIITGRGEDRGEVGMVTKIKTNDKLKALELLGRYHKMFTDKVEQTGKDGGPIEMVIRPQVSREEWLKLHGMAE